MHIWCRIDDHAHSAQFAEFAEFLIEMWAWHMARVKHATEAGGERLGQRLSETLATEKEQGMFGSLVTSQPVSLPRATSRVCTELLGMRCFLLLSCLVREKILNGLVFLLAEMCIRLREFVGQMKSAINALCGF